MKTYLHGHQMVIKWSSNGHQMVIKLEIQTNDTTNTNNTNDTNDTNETKQTKHTKGYDDREGLHGELFDGLLPRVTLGT